MHLLKDYREAISRGFLQEQVWHPLASTSKPPEQEFQHSTCRHYSGLQEQTSQPFSSVFQMVPYAHLQAICVQAAGLHSQVGHPLAFSRNPFGHRLFIQFSCGHSRGVGSHEHLSQPFLSVFQVIPYGHLQDTLGHRDARHWQV